MMMTVLRLNNSRYFNWLTRLIRLRDHKEFEDILRSLSQTPFRVFVEHDENRALDGIELRIQYEELEQKPAPSGPCSVLEVLIGLAKRMEFFRYDPMLDEDQTDLYFWELIQNLKLNPRDNSGANMDKINFWIERRFNKNGIGSPFPLRFVTKNQRDVELWYQMQAYISEKMSFCDKKVSQCDESDFKNVTLF